MEDFSYYKIIFSLVLLCSSFYFMSNKKEMFEKKHFNILRETAGECTLFLNKNNIFPIDKPCNVLLIGSGARNTIKGGLGSSNVDPKHSTTCEEGLEKAGFKITSKDWLNQYILLKEKKISEHIKFIKNLNTKNKANMTNAYRTVSFPEYDYELKIDQDTKNKSDIAIYVLSRSSGEGMDRRLIKGDVLLTDTEIKDILYLQKKFSKFMLVLNVVGVVDISPVSQVSNILLLSQLGEVTGDILADIILGKVNPSGKLTTTWAKIDDYKFLNEFGDGNDTNYKEGIYVGYRYFDSAGLKPLYPFGFGQSYTSFEISKISLANIRDEIIIKLKVKNIGQFPGKEVIQIYVSPTQNNMDKPFQSLVAFKKTKILKPKKEIEMTISFELKSVARYDKDMASYILDKGNYIIRVGNSSRNTKIYGYIELDENIVTEQLANIDGVPDFSDYKPNIVIKDDLTKVQKIKLTKNDFNFKKVKYEYEYKVYDKLLKLNDTELAYLCMGHYLANKNETNEKPRGINGLTTKRLKQIKPYLRMIDGPHGLRLSRVYYADSKGYHRLSKAQSLSTNFKYLSKNKKIRLFNNETEDYSNYSNVYYQYATALPIGTAMGQSFNLDLVEKYGKIVGKELEIYKIDILLAPGLNIHRNILCGRNFEYYSEDPYISGNMAAAMVRGVQSHKKKGATIKHFTGNNQEINRFNSNSKISERALREIYLKGFQIAIEKSKPIALMTSYNLINGIHPSSNEQLLVNVLRNEWNFKGVIMTDWTKSGDNDFGNSKYPAQNIYENILGGNDLMMPGSEKDYNMVINKLEEKKLSRDDLLRCASKVYETIILLKK